MDQILGTEQNEFLNNRQTAKIQYLQQQNRQLQEDIEDLQNSLKLNKEALQLAYEQQLKLSQQSSQVQKGGNNSTVIASKSNNNAAALLDSQTKVDKQLLDKMVTENKKLVYQVDKLMKERNMAQTKALIAEQISEENQNFQKEVVIEQDEKILELRRIIHDKEYAIQEFEKIHPQNLPNGTVLKVREIITPHEQSMKLHQEVESFRYIIQRLTSENQSMTEKNKFLLDYNNNLKREVLKMRLVISNPVNFHKMKEMLYGQQLDNNEDNVELHKYFYEQYFKNEEADEIARDYVGELKYQEYIGRQNQQLRQQNQQNQNSAQYLQSRQQLFDKIEALEYALHNYKKLFSREFENNKMLQENITSLQRHNREIIEYNEILINSNKMHQEKLKAQHSQIELYKAYYYKYMDMLRNRRKHNLSQANTPVNINNLISEGLFKKNKAEGNIFPDTVIQKNLKEQQQEQPKEILEEVINDSNPNNQEISQIEQEIAGEVVKEEEENVVNVSILDEDGQPNQATTPKGQKKPQQQQEEPDSIKKKLITKNNQQVTQQDQQEQFKKQMEGYHEMSMPQAKQYLLNLAKELYINLSHSNTAQGITRHMLKNIQLGNGMPGQRQLFRVRRSVSNPLDYTSKEFLNKVVTIKFEKMENNPNLDLQNNNNNEQSNANPNDIYNNIQFQPHQQLQSQQTLTQPQDQYGEQDYYQKQQLVTQQCNYDFEEQRAMNSNMIVIQNKNRQQNEFQFQTQMNSKNDNFNQEHANNILGMQNQQTTTNQKIKVNIGLPFDVGLEKIENKHNHKKKITIHNFNADGDSFLSDQDELQF